MADRQSSFSRTPRGVKSSKSKKRISFASDVGGGGGGGGGGSALRSKGELIFRLVIRFIQLIMAASVAGLYGVRLDQQRKAHQHAASQWIYAEVVAGIAGITCLVYFSPVGRMPITFVWDFIVFILWTALFGLFGSIYIHRNVSEPYQGYTNTRLMKNAVWIDLVNMLLWFVTMLIGAGIFLFRPGGRSARSSV